VEPYPDGTSEEQREPLREWQKDTWYGPFPTHEDPFDEPEDAPELRDLRSDDLNNRSGQFWETQTSGYRFGQKTSAPDQPAKPKPAEPGHQKRIRRLTVLGSVAALAAVWLILYYVVFAVRTIQVTGNKEISSEDIISLSGIREGEPILALNSDAVEQRLETNPVLRMNYLEKSLPSTVIISVREREPCCWITWNGILYIMDSKRVVLRETENEAVVIRNRDSGEAGTSETNPEEETEADSAEQETAGQETDGASEKAQPNEKAQAEQEAKKEEERLILELQEIIGSLVKVDGLKIRSGAMVGQTLQLENSDQQSVFSELFLQMKVLSCMDLIEEADLSNLSSLLLTTRDGFTVSMGSSSDLHAKLRSMLLTREELLRRGYQGGVINVTLPETPIYSPPGV